MKREDFRFTSTSIRDHLEAIQQHAEGASRIISNNQSSKADDLNSQARQFQPHIKVDSEWNPAKLRSSDSSLPTLFKSFGERPLNVDEHLAEIKSHTQSALDMLCGSTQSPKPYQLR
jgi:hypothetical protein